MRDNLREHGQGIFLSGVESDRYWGIVVDEGGIENVLTSYYYFRKHKDNPLAERLRKHPNTRVFIDSGAFTFKEQGQGKSLKDWELYIEEYVKWALENKEYIIAVANLDIEALVGEAKVQEWNRKYFEPLEAKGLPVCYIWHPRSGFPLWENYCKQYNYIGISSEVISESETMLKRLFSIAKKYNTLVHGMAFTKSQLLVKYPFYSIDSTSWIVGQQYGELNWWDGRSMKRLKKNIWRRTYKTRLLKPPFNADWDKLINGMGGKGDTYELLRLNTIAYKVAQEYIRKRLGSRQYWLGSDAKMKLKMKKSKETVKPSYNLPTWEWFDGDCANYKDYAKDLNINTSLPKQDVIDVLRDYRRFILQESESVGDFSEERWLMNAKLFCEEEASSEAEAREMLKQYFLANADGDLDDFNQTDDIDAEDEDEDDIEEEESVEYSALPRDLITEDEYEESELTEEDLAHNTLLPAPESMDEVNEYDKELSSHGISVQRDRKGKFLKGVKHVRKQKKVYSEKYPQLICNTCYKSGDCPEYKAGYVCAYSNMFNRFDTRKADDIMDAMTSMVDLNLGRMQRAIMFETMDGGMPTGEVTGLIDQNMKLLQQLNTLVKHSPHGIMAQRKMNPDGSIVDTVVQANPTGHGGSFLDKLFSEHMKGTQFVDEDDVDPDFTPFSTAPDLSKPNHIKQAVDVDYTVITEPTKSVKINEQVTPKKSVKLKKKQPV
jgi:hypothetical protein